MWILVSNGFVLLRTHVQSAAGLPPCRALGTERSNVTKTQLIAAAEQSVLIKLAPLLTSACMKHTPLMCPCI